MGYLSPLTLDLAQEPKSTAVGTRVNEHPHWYLHLHEEKPPREGSTNHIKELIMNQKNLKAEEDTI
jgi:hypothetical protein